MQSYDFYPAYGIWLYRKQYISGKSIICRECFRNPVTSLTILKYRNRNTVSIQANIK